MKIGYFLADVDVLDVAQLDQVAQAAGQCDRLVVGVVKDDDLVELTGHRPLHPLTDRLDLAAALKGVAQVFPHAVGWLPQVGRGQQLDVHVSSPLFARLLPGLATVVKPRLRSVSDFASALPWQRDIVLSSQQLVA